MISENDDRMFKDAHDKWALIVNEWNYFITLNDPERTAWLLEQIPILKYYFAMCSFCDRYVKNKEVGSSPCTGCPLGEDCCLDDYSLYNDVVYRNDYESACKILKIIDDAWKKAKGE